MSEWHSSLHYCFFILVFSTARLREADLICPVCPADMLPKSFSYDRSLKCFALPPFSSACVNGPGSCPGGGDVVCMLLSVSSGLIVPALNSQPPYIHNLSLLPLLWPAGIISLGEYAGAADIVRPHGKHKHMYVIGHGHAKVHIMWNQAWTHKSNGSLIDICAYVNAHAEFVLSGGLTKLVLSLSFGSHYGPGLLSESLYSLREVPICGSMWQGGSKSSLMNQYVGGLSLWRGRPRAAIQQPGKNVCICSHQTLLMSADI